MGKFRIKIDKEKGIAYIPKSVREELGNEVEGIPNACAAVIFSKEADLEDVKESLKILLQDVSHRCKLNNKKKEE